MLYMDLARSATVDLRPFDNGARSRPGCTSLSYVMSFRTFRQFHTGLPCVFPEPSWFQAGYNSVGTGKWPSPPKCEQEANPCYKPPGDITNDAVHSLAGQPSDRLSECSLYKRLSVREHSAGWVNKGANPAIRRANEETTLLDGSKLRESHMLPGFQRVAKPSIVRQVDNQISIPMAEHIVDETGIEILVADVSRDGMSANLEWLERGSWREVPRIGRPTIKDRKSVAQWQILAKREQERLVVTPCDRTGPVRR